MSVIIYNKFYTCECELKNIKYPYSIRDDVTIIKNVSICKCKKCKTKVSQLQNTFTHSNFDTNKSVYGFCGTCMSFVLNNEIVETPEEEPYEIVKKPLYGKGCKKCYGNLIFID